MRATPARDGARDALPLSRISDRGRSAQRTSKPERSSGCSSSTSTDATSARLGPRRQKSTSDSTASGSPSNTASTVRSGVFRIHPATPADSARCLAVSRKKTPWTRPLITTRLRVSGYSSSSYSEATPPPSRPKTSDEETGGDCTETQHRSDELPLELE